MHGEVGIAVSREGGDKSPPCAVRLHSSSADPTCPAQDLLGWQEQEMLPHLGQAANAAEPAAAGVLHFWWLQPAALSRHCHATEEHTQQSVMSRCQQAKGKGLHRQISAKNEIGLFISLEIRACTQPASR